ncbi:hypothetical protein DEV92_12015 [Phyllobacterium myrsinacearum]|nr:hypothetical protein DEV92_12015 [Phyllobacterium myrsinacearum]RZS74083.1 hypothetical protein EV217_5159 [Phyllobacterium myrsinacearum]RZV04740.1 hypothetical protein EV654_3543 [Phyllobacterium myrsinacearum]
MKPQKKPFVVEIKHGRRGQKSPVASIWGDIDMSTYGLSEDNRPRASEVSPRINAADATDGDDHGDQ